MLADLQSPPAVPFSEQAEASVVGRLLANPKVIGSVVGAMIEPGHFYLGAYRLLYHEILAAYYADDPIDPLTIGELCSKPLSRTWGCSESEAVERVQTLAVGQRGGSEAAVDHGRLVKRDHDYRALLDLAATVQRRVGEEDAGPEELAAELAHLATQVATSALTTDELVSFEDLGKHLIVEQKKLMAARAQGIELGVWFGLTFLDSHLRGLRPTELLILAGEPGAGKSAVAWKAAQRFAERQLKKPEERRIGTLVASLEMGQDPSEQRFATAISAIPGSKLREGSMEQADLSRLVDEWGRRRELPLWTNFTSNMRLTQLRALVIEAIRRHNVGLVVIDHWKYLDTDRHYRNPLDEDEAKARFLKQDVAKQLNVAVMCLAHTTKGASAREDARPRMADLRGSGYIAAHADWIAFVHRPYKHASAEAIEEGDVQRTDAELIFEKTRHGIEAVSEMFFDPSTMTIY